MNPRTPRSTERDDAYPPGVGAQGEQARRARARALRLTTLRLVREGSFVVPVEDAARLMAHLASGSTSGTPTKARRLPIRGPRDVFALMAPYAAREVGESFWILPLDGQHRLAGTGPTVITRGILTASLVHPREVFLAAIVASAAALVLVHNHPSGDPTPSPEDHAITAQLVAAGALLDIPVHDHVIVGHGRYVSFAEGGLL